MRPRVICHMGISVDGRIVVRGWPAPAAAALRREYEKIHSDYDPDGWLCGRITMEPFAGGVRADADVKRERTGTSKREDFVAPGEHDSFAFALDARGKLDWRTNDIDGDHVVAILSERVSDDYLARLRERGVSYVLSGTREVELAGALETIGASFGVKTLMLEGGGGINGSMLHAGLIDEVSVLVAPVADGRIATPTLFDAESGAAASLTLESVERRDNDVLWLRYRVLPRT